MGETFLPHPLFGVFWGKLRPISPPGVQLSSIHKPGFSLGPSEHMTLSIYLIPKHKHVTNLAYPWVLPSR